MLKTDAITIIASAMILRWMIRQDYGMILAIYQEFQCKKTKEYPFLIKTQLMSSRNPNQ